ncbi:SDH family Clp fold serine proteinase [Nannocystis pusilla]|uniref:SDH family Clp fold serine proteinase n=1 Tax=Nannocystis pusilla TaxID=889268 RepID=UPI003B7A301F
MSRAALVTALITGSALVGAGYILTRRPRQQALTSSVVPIVTPVIDIGIAEDVLAAMERLPKDEVTVVLHTSGGCVASCVMIANALREFEKSTAIVPYMAISGGTMIALNATQLQMGGSASLSAVDPIIAGQRARHLPEDDKSMGLHALGQEYEAAIGEYIRETLAARLPGASEAKLERAFKVFMGEAAPHEWPIRRPQVQALGLPVSPATRTWAEMVDAYRRRWW